MLNFAVMDRSYCIDQLSRHRGIFHQLLTGLTEEDIRFRPTADKWSLLEVICHLRDEEREDFRARVQHVLTTPDQPMPKIDPAAWVSERDYAAQDFATVLNEFLSERERSVEWLRASQHLNWTNAYMHPKVGPVSCDLLLVNWVAHDLLHMRQIVKLRYDTLPGLTTEPLDYAGSW